MRMIAFGIGILALATVGCGSGADATTTTAPGTTTANVPAVTPPGPGEPWDLLYISDSGGWGVAPLLAEQAAAALGVEVRVHDQASGGLSAVTALQRIRGETYPDISNLVRQAEIIVVYGNPEDSGVDSDIGTCVSTSLDERDPPAADTRYDWQPYRELLDELYNAIWDLREGTPTVLRAVDLYNPVISAWRAAGIEPECTAAWELWSSVIREAADANGAVMVSAYDVLNGPDHGDDPREKGYILPDGEHTTPAGAAAIAEAIAAAGFEPTARPGR